MLFVKHAPDTLTYTMQTIQRQWTADEIPVLQAALSVPQCTGDRPGRTARRLSRYYRQCTEAFLRYCGRELDCWCYQLASYPSGEENVTAVLYTCKGRAVAGDIHSNALGGFMHGIK